VTLRGRLTIVLLAVVLGPLLLGAYFVGETAAAVERDRAAARLDLAANTVRSSVSAACQQLYAAADAVAVGADHAARSASARQVVARGLASAVRITDARGAMLFATADWPAPPWADCGGSATSGPVPRALSALVEMRDQNGAAAGTVAVTQILDAGFVSRLAAATGVAVTLRDSRTPAPSPRNTGSAGGADDGAAASGSDEESVVIASDGRYVRRSGPSPGQPLPLVLSVPDDPHRELFALIGIAVVGAALLAVLAARRLARSTTRPLTELAAAADRVAAGDLSARVPVRTEDEVGRLATAFNRMARETQAYVQALTAGRDQLRGQLEILGTTLSSTHDLPRILQVILQTALVTTGARAGAVVLPDGNGRLIGHYAKSAGRERSGPVVIPLRTRVGAGLLGQVSATGEARRGRRHEVGPELAPDEPLCAAYLAVPVAAPAPLAPDAAGSAEAPAKPAAAGVLALYDPLGSAEFDDDDLATVRTFAEQAAVAVTNVRLHEESQRLSLTDPLTGLGNYRSFKDVLRREVERASRFGRLLCVLALDLDRFKEVNDTYGHAAGDVVLAEFARRLRGGLREVDFAFRQGGEEFAVLLPETDAYGGTTVAKRLGAAIRDTPVVVDLQGTMGQPAISVTVSIGIAVFPDHGATAQQVIDAADAALYAAKAAGRDTYRVAEVAERPERQEIAVAASAGSPDERPPQASHPDDRTHGDATSGPQPPRQSRGR
jgi:two-component system cell cycle response regulator